eukprot:4113178-Amphidinium_carterae.1
MSVQKVKKGKTQQKHTRPQNNEKQSKNKKQTGLNKFSFQGVLVLGALQKDAMVPARASCDSSHGHVGRAAKWQVLLQASAIV